MNFRHVRGPFGGANSFLRTLRDALERRGVAITSRTDGRYDVALLNALTEDIDLDYVRRLAERGTPIVHRKVGYRASGSPEMRAEVDGAVRGDLVQIEFSPYLTHSVFQSAYSRDVFLASGFDGPFSVIHNGVDERVFDLIVRNGPLRRPRRRELWNGREPVRVAVSTWSTDENKGFPEYRRIDRQLAGRHDVELTMVGRVPTGTRFQHIRVLPPRAPRQLAQVLRHSHVLLQLARHETCSNALLEGMNCGLPVVYMDSGSNRELAEPYGVAYKGDIFAALDEVRERYGELVERLASNPYRIGLVVERYLELLEQVRR